MFQAPFMLVGLSAAVLPVVLHLLSRARFTTVDWGAMMFLDTPDTLQRHSSRLHQWILLFVRTALIALLAIALARPVLKGQLAAPAPGQRVVAVLLLDCSASMGFEENGHARMVLARGAAKQVLALHKGDRASLVLMGREQHPAERAPTSDLWDVGRRIDTSSPGYGRASIARGLTDALDALQPMALADFAEKPFIRFYIITDRQSSSWREVDEKFTATWRERLTADGLSARMYVVPVGGAEADNVAVESVELLNGPAVVGQPAEMEVRLKNYGSVQWAGLPLTVTTTGAQRNRILDTHVNLMPNADATFRASVTFDQPGTRVVTAEINRQVSNSTTRATGFAPDDRVESVVEVIEPIRVLVISGDERTAIEPEPVSSTTSSPTTAPSTRPSVGMFGEADYLQLALAPFQAMRKRGGDLSTVDVGPVEGWTGASITLSHRGDREAGREVRLSEYQVGVLANIERFTPRQVAAVEQFVYDGGGLLVAPGNLSRPVDYNSMLFRGGTGILPGALHTATADDGSEQTALGPFEVNHPIFRFLHGSRSQVQSSVVGRYFPIASRNPAARVLASYAAGSPFLMELRAGHGRVLLMTTSLDADWTTLPLTSFYLPFVQSTVRYLADTSVRRVNLLPGEAIEVPFDEPVAGRVVRITTPDGQKKSVEILQPGDLSVARYSETEQPGRYTLDVFESGRKVSTVHFVVRGSREESDLSPLTAQRWQWIQQEFGAERLDSAESALSSSAAATSGAVELWGWALAGVMLLAVAEMVLARRWSHEVEGAVAG